MSACNCNRPSGKLIAAALALGCLSVAHPSLSLENPFAAPEEVIEEHGNEPFPAEPLVFKSEDPDPKPKPKPENPPPAFKFEGHVRLGEVLYAAVRKNGKQVLVPIRTKFDGFRFISVTRHRLVVEKKGKKHVLTPN